MKFACDSCQAEFLIADEKVGRRGVKVRCKRCSHVIIVRPTPESLSSLDAADDMEPDDDEARVPPELDEESGENAVSLAENIPTEMEAGEPEEENEPKPPAAFSGEATQITPAPQATVPMTEPATAGPSPEAQQHADEVRDAMIPDVDDEAPEQQQQQTSFPSDDPEPVSADGADELDEQLEGAFAQMFDDASVGGEQLDDGDEDDEQQLTDIQPQAEVMPGFANTGFATPLSPSLLGLQSDEASDLPDAAAESNEPAQIWFLAVGDENVGPLTADELRGYFERGEMDGASLVWQEEMPDWEHASQVPALESLFNSAVAPVAAEGLLAAPVDLGEPSAAAPQMNDVVSSPLDLGSSPLDGAFGSSTFSEMPSADEGWKPGAASALASLVEAEMQRPDDTGAMVEDSAPAETPVMPAVPAEDREQGSGESVPAALFAASASAGGVDVLGSTPPTAAPGQGQPAGNLASLASAHPSILPAAPYGAPVAATRPMWQIGAMLVAVVGVAALAKIAFFGPASDAVQPRQLQPAEAVSSGQSTTPPTPPPASPPAAPVANPTGASLAAADPAGAKTETAGAATAQADPGAAAPASAVAPAPAPPAPPPAKNTKAKKSRKARSSRPKPAPAPPKVAAPAPPPAPAPTAAPAPKAEARPASASRKKSNPNCDPVLDFDCDEAPKSPKAKKSRAAAKKSLSRDDVLIVVKKNLSGVHGCFDKHGGKGPVKMQWRIAKSGRTTKVKVLSKKYRDTSLGSCLQDKIRGWRFPKYSGKAPPPVTIPFKARS